MNQIDARTSQLLDELAWLAADAQRRLDASDTTTRWHQLGQRNTYARTIGALLATRLGQDASEITDRVIDALAAGVTDPARLAAAALDQTATPARKRRLDWLGPKAFQARYGRVPGIDQDYGMRWGRNGDQRISLRRQPGACEGLLYAYDPTWDEYAILRRRVPTAVVDRLFTAALRHGEHVAIEDFARLVDTERSRPLHAVPDHTMSIGVQP